MRAYHVFAVVAWQEMLGSAVQAQRDRDCSQDLKDNDVKTVGRVLQGEMAV